MSALRTVLLPLIALTLSAAAAPPVTVPMTLPAWDLLDLAGDALVYEEPDPGAPPGHAATLEAAGDTLLLMPQGVRLTDGTLLVLYRELDPHGADADGVLLFGADYPDDLSAAHNTKEWRVHYWFEQDNDSGLGIRRGDAPKTDAVLAQAPGVGRVDDPWNATGWIWQKVRLSGTRVQAKYWPASEAEPAGWALEADWPGVASGRIGVKINSGRIRLAHFAYGTDDLAVSPPTAWLVAADGAPDPAVLRWQLYRNGAAAAAAPATFTLTREGAPEPLLDAAVALPAAEAMTVLVCTPERAGDEAPAATLDAPLAPGRYRAVLRSPAIDAAAEFAVEGAGGVRERLARLEALLAQAAAAVTQDPRARTARDAAAGHLGLARDQLAAGSRMRTARSLAHAAGAMAEFGALAGSAALRAEAESLAEAGDAAASAEAKTQGFSPAARIGLIADDTAVRDRSLVMGQTHALAVTLNRAGAPIDRELALRARLVSLRTIAPVAETSQPLEPPPARWAAQPAAYVQNFTLDLPRPDSVEKPAQPVVLDEAHALLVQLFDPATGAVWPIDAPPGPQADVPGTWTLAARLHVSSVPLAIAAAATAQAASLQPAMLAGMLRNAGAPPGPWQVLATVRAETGAVVYRGAAMAEAAAAGEALFAIPWTPAAAGGLEAEFEVLEAGRTVTRAMQRIAVSGPALEVTAPPRAALHGGAIVTAVGVRVAGAALPWQARAFSDGRPMGEAVFDAPEGTLQLAPAIGYYDLEAESGGVRSYRRIVATAIETRGRELLVNGEPFLIKGLNVHSLDSASPERTRLMMRIFRGLGFNMLRGDYPPRWMIDMAAEENLGWSVLAPFSIVSTHDLEARMDGPAFGAARETTRAFVARYADSAGTMLWNSANEIEGDIGDFLVAVRPVYAERDPYRRPVHYANLYGQDRYMGQDAVGVNYYFDGVETPASRHPQILRNIEATPAQPLFFTEFNGFNGAIHADGVAAMRGFFDWGVDRGMSGGFYYFRFNSERHPGVIDDGYRTHALLDAALRASFDDARVACLRAGPDRLRLRIENRRAFALRGVSLDVAIDGAAHHADLPDIPAQTSIETEAPLPHAAGAIDAAGALRFTTHHGFRERVPFRIVAERQER